MPFFSPHSLPSSKTSFPELMVSDLISNGSWNLSLLISLFTPFCVKKSLRFPSIITYLHLSFGPLPQMALFPLVLLIGWSTTKEITLIISPLDSSTWKALWKLKLNARLILFLWKIAWNLLPSKARLKAVFQIPSSDSLCPLCSSEEDYFPYVFQLHFCKSCMEILILASWFNGLVLSFSFNLDQRPHTPSFLVWHTPCWLSFVLDFCICIVWSALVC